MNPTTYHNETPQAVRDVIDRLIRSRTRVRLWYGDTVTGRSYGDEWDVLGHISRSTGTQPIPILIHNSRSMGGGGVLCHCIVAIRAVGGGWLYKHPAFDPGVYKIAPDGERFAVSRDGETVARFDTERKAARWVAFMRGERMGK